MHKGGGEGSSQMRTIEYKGGGEGGFKVACVRKKICFGLQNRKAFLFCAKEAITLPFIIVYRKA